MQEIRDDILNYYIFGALLFLNKELHLQSVVFTQDFWKQKQNSRIPAFFANTALHRSNYYFVVVCGGF